MQSDQVITTHVPEHPGNFHTTLIEDGFDEQIYASSKDLLQAGHRVAGVEPASPVVSDTVEPAPVELPASVVPEAPNVFAEAQRLADLAAALGRPIDADVALTRARIALGLTESAPVAPAPAQEPESANEPSAPDLEAIETRLREIDDIRKTAVDDYDPEKLSALIDQQRELLLAHANAVAAKTRSDLLEQQRADEAFVEQWTAAEEQVREMYPNLFVKGTPEFAAMAEMQQKLEALGDANVFAADGPKYIANKVALALGLAPSLSSVTPAASGRPVASSTLVPGRGPGPYSGAASGPINTNLSTLLEQAANDDQVYLEIQRALTGGRR